MPGGVRRVLPPDGPDHLRRHTATRDIGSHHLTPERSSMAIFNVQYQEFPDPADAFPIGTRFMRPKKSIYPIVADFHKKKAHIDYVAHAYTKDLTYVLIHPAITGTENSPANHPDQKYWQLRAVATVLKPIAAKVEHIEIDCTLLPCAHDKGSCCLVKVPQLIKGLLGRDVPLVIYSHRKEFADIGATPTEGARFVCNTGDDAATLNTKLVKNTHAWEWYGAP
jgi:hypothetical protein